MRIAKWGNSLAVRLPAAMIQQLGLKEGDEVELKASDQKVFEIKCRPSRAELVERLHAFHGLIGSDIKFDRDEANAR